MRQFKTSPKSMGYTMPFEGNPHQGTIVLLPYRTDTWRCHAKPARKVFLELIEIIRKYEKVYLIADPRIPEAELEPFCLPGVEILRLPYNDSWARDNTLIYLTKTDGLLAVDFRFNAWGGAVDGLYPDYAADDALGKRVAEALRQPLLSLPDFILEGGSIHTDGEGTLLVTEACLLSAGRNAGMTKAEIEELLKESLGMDKVLWLKHGIYNDETNEHIDNMACFLSPGVIAVAVSRDKEDIQYVYSTEAVRTLERETDAKGRPLQIIQIPVPAPLQMTAEEADTLILGEGIQRLAGNRLAASYINFYQSDRFVIVPKFNVKEDEEALQILKNFYRDKDVYQLESREILLGGGNIHCITMQIPKEEKKNEN